MKKLGLMVLVLFISVIFVACVDSKDSRELQTLDSKDSQIESNVNSNKLRKSSQSLAWEKADCDFLIKLWGITKERCDMLDSIPDIATIEAKNIEQAYHQLLLDDDYYVSIIRGFLLKELPIKNYTHTDKAENSKYTTTYKWKDEKTLEINIQHPDDCTDDYYTFFDLGNGRIKIMRNQETC